MNKKTLGLIAILLGALLFVVGIVIPANQKATKVNHSPIEYRDETEEGEMSDFEKSVEEHTHYIQDEHLDPFKDIEEESGDIEIGKLDFDFKYLSNATYENTAAQLIDKTDNYLLFRNHNDVLSYYDVKKSKKYVLDEAVDKAIISPDEKYIVYSKNAFNRESFFYLDLETLQHKEFNTYYYGAEMSVLDMKYKNGIIYYIIQDAKTLKKAVRFVSLPTYTNGYTAYERDSSVGINTDKLYYYNNSIYGFNENTKSLQEIEPNRLHESVLKVTSEKIQRLQSIEFYDKDTWAIAITNDKNESVLITPNGKTKEFKGLISAHWYDKNHLIVNDNLSLYLYDVKNNEKSVIKTDIAYIFSSNNTIDIQTGEGEILRLEKSDS